MGLGELRKTIRKLEIIVREMFGIFGSNYGMLYAQSINIIMTISNFPSNILKFNEFYTRKRAQPLETYRLVLNHNSNFKTMI